MAETHARKLADLILFMARERNTAITNLKLQKLLYYCQAWHLAFLGSSLFPERIEAWIHGPVVPPVFGQFKEYRWKPIPFDGSMPDIEFGDAQRPIREHVSDVLDAYGNLTGPQLEVLTHREDPWRNARKGIPPDQPSTAIISLEAMVAFYRPQIALADTF